MIQRRGPRTEASSAPSCTVLVRRAIRPMTSTSAPWSSSAAITSTATITGVRATIQRSLVQISA